MKYFDTLPIQFDNWWCAFISCWSRRCVGMPPIPFNRLFLTDTDTVFFIKEYQADTDFFQVIISNQN